jgi:peptidoglycan/xylan/chitin deacetylase (PgdA/CDA1 family)
VSYSFWPGAKVSSKPGAELKSTILTYHSQNIAGNDTGNNDHVALAADLEALHGAGACFISLDNLVKGLFYGGELPESQVLVSLTFDDGCNFDFQTIEYPGFGLQTGFLQIMEQFVQRHGVSAQPGLHATSFVIADPEARRIIDSKSLFGQGHMTDDWWKQADTHPLMSIANHSWDHNHPDLEDARHGRGTFDVIESFDDCHFQVVRAAEFIGRKTGCYPELFAYPFGQSSRYMREVYFPEHQHRHGSIAAVGTEPALVTEKSDRWNLPRFVCGRDWSEPGSLLKLLGLQAAADSGLPVAVEIQGNGDFRRA